MHLAFLLLTAAFVPSSFAGTPDGALDVKTDVSYVDSPSSDSLRQKCCKLDLYMPKRVGKYPILVWFHGGGLTGGDKFDASAVGTTLAREGVGVAVANYRLSPGVTFPSYVQDAAQAVAWIKKHALELGADPDKVFVGGHSAGAWLSAMLAMDERYLKNAGIQQSEIAGFIPVSGQMATHFTVRKERGISENTVISDEAAPMYFTRKQTRPVFLVVADADLPARLEENQYFAAALKAAGNSNVWLKVLEKRDHASIVEKIPEPDDPCAQLIGKFILSPN